MENASLRSIFLISALFQSLVVVLSSAGKDDEAKEKYIEGIQALTAYGFRKDRTLSEVLYSSVPFQKAYGTLGVEWFYELYHMTMTVVAHTDGKSTSSYPVEWYKEFVKIYPDEALKFLITETLESTEANWHQEEEFFHILEKCASLFRPTQWFLLCRSLPLAASDEIVALGLKVINQIDIGLQDVYVRWLQSRPNTQHSEEEAIYSQETAIRFEEQFGIKLKSKEEDKTQQSDNLFPNSSTPSPFFPNASVDDAMAFLEENVLTEDHVNRLQELLLLTTNQEEKEALLRQAAKSFKYGRDVGDWVEELFESGSYEWLYFNVCLFVFRMDGWFHGLHYTHYLSRSYENSPEETISILREILGYFFSENKYNSSISRNLINALSELRIEVSIVQDVLQTTFQLVKRRLPHPPNSEINASIYQGLEGLNRDEMVVALLIARLKTLTTEKTQGIIWSLTYIAQMEPGTLMKPYFWAFSNHEFLLPIHRALLLQILKEFVDQSLISDEVIGQLILNYPTGFFLEDQYIRSFVDYKIELEENSAKGILLPAHHYDNEFLLRTHVKYRTLDKHFGPLLGTYNAYAQKRDVISKEYDSYYIRNAKVVTSIVPFADASYTITNSQYYDDLKQLTYRYSPSYICDLHFFLEEMVTQVGALARRPQALPTPESFPLFEVRNASHAFEYEGWVMLASEEKELYGEDFKPKESRSSSIVLTFGKEPVSGEYFHGRYLFRANQYVKYVVDNAPFDQPICTLTIFDTLERSCIVYVSPFVVKELGLTIDFTIHSGFQAYNDKGEVVIKLVTWKEDYYGSVSSGTEVARLEGVAVVIRADYYEQLLNVYQEESWLVLSQEG